jgi:hypothetical protein
MLLGVGALLSLYFEVLLILLLDHTGLLNLSITQI